MHAGGEMPVENSHDRRLLTTNRGTELGRRWHFYKPNPPSIQQRDDLVQTVRRCIRRNDGECELVRLCRFTHLLDADHRPSAPHTQSEESKDALPHGVIIHITLRCHHAALSPSPPRVDSSPLLSSVVS